MFYSLSTATFTFIQARLYQSGIVVELSFIDFNTVNGFALGFALGALNSIAELPNSFIKRRLSIKSGGINSKRQFLQYVMDQLDSPILLSFFLFFVGLLGLKSSLTVLVIGTLVHAAVDHFMYYKRGIKSWEQSEAPWTRPMLWTVQAITLPIWKLLLFGVFRAELDSKPRHLKITREQKYILYSNHQSSLDAIALSVMLPAFSMLKLLPFRYITANVHFYHPVKGFLLHLVGGYPSKPNKKKEGHGINRSIHLLNHNQTLIYFPEGKRTNSRVAAKRGLREISIAAKPILIPAYISWNKTNFWKRKTVIRIGKPFQYKDQSSEELLDIVYKLDNKQTE